MPVEAEYRDYRDVQGVRIPFEIESENEATGRVVTRLRSIEVDPELKDDPYQASPPPPLPTVPREAVRASGTKESS
jgi:hypothetical protein